jgi:DNA polymerase V
MENQLIYNASYRGSRQFSQKDVPTANATGFGAPADDYMERGIDLNEQLILNKPATFFFRMNSDAMCGDGIFSGDVLIVDRSLNATNGKIIVAVIDGELLVRRLQKNFNTAILTASNNKVADIPLTAFSERNLVWGVVTCVIHIYENSLFINTKKNNVKAKDSNNSKRIYY